MSTPEDSLINTLKRVVETMGPYKDKENGFKAYVKLSDMEASYEVIPQATAAAVGNKQESITNYEVEPITQAQAIVKNYESYLTWEETDKFYWIRTKRKLEDKFGPVADQLKAVGFTYIRYREGVKYTGGWERAK